MPPMLLAASLSRLPARRRGGCCCRLRLGGSDGSTGSSGAAKAARRRRRATFPSAKGKSLSQKCSKLPTRPRTWSSPRPRWSSTRARTATRSASSQRDRTQVTDAEVALYFAKVPEAPSKRVAKSKPAAKGAAARGRRSKPSKSRRSVPSRPRSKASQTEPAFRAQTTTSDPERRHGRLLDQGQLPQQRRVADRGADQEGRRNRRRPLLPSADRRRLHTEIPRVGQKAPLIHTPTRRRRRRRPLEDHDPHPAGHAERGRLRRCARQGTDRPLVCDPPVLPESGLRARRRRGRAGQTAIRRQGGVHPHGDLQRQRPEQGRAPAGAGLPPAQRAVAVRDRPRWEDQGRDRGRLRRRRTDPRGEGTEPQNE